MDRIFGTDKADHRRPELVTEFQTYCRE